MGTHTDRGAMLDPLSTGPLHWVPAMIIRAIFGYVLNHSRPFFIAPPIHHNHSFTNVSQMRTGRKGFSTFNVPEPFQSLRQNIEHVADHSPSPRIDQPQSLRECLFCSFSFSFLFSTASFFQFYVPIASHFSDVSFLGSGFSSCSQ
ncbi:hypothetical protein ACSQ67_024855 [Phaseolus vulgaris]